MDKQGRAGESFLRLTTGPAGRKCGHRFRAHLSPGKICADSDGFGRAISRFLSAPCGGENHLSKRPIPGIRPLSRRWNGPLRDSLFGLAPDGVFRAVSLALHAVRSYRTFSPSPRRGSRKLRRAVCFLWHCPSERLAAIRPSVSQSYGLELRGVVPYGVRTFLPRLAPGAILHPSKTGSSIIYSAQILKPARNDGTPQTCGLASAAVQ